MDWLLHCDADDFISFEPEAFQKELTSIPPEILALQVPNGERAWLRDAPDKDIYSGVMILPIPQGNHHLKPRLGANKNYYNAGLLGYTAGKCLTRTGCGLFLGIHRPKHSTNGRPDNRRLPTSRSTSARIIHFDGLSPIHWMIKLISKVPTTNSREERSKQIGSARMAQIEFLQHSLNTPFASARQLHDSLRIFDPDREQRWREAGLLQELPIDVSAAVREILADVNLDLSRKTHDAWLARKTPALFSKFC